MVSLFCRTRSTMIFNQYRSSINCLHNIALHTHANAFSSPTFDINTQTKAFLDVLPEVVNSVITGPVLSQVPEASYRVKQVLDYTLGEGKLFRGLKVAIGYRIFEDPSYFSEETQHSACVLGWTIEMAYLMILDDMIYGATMRRGKPCWHQQPDIGFTAINDAILLCQSMMQVLEIYFGKTPIYTDLVQLFNEGILKASMGEHLDVMSSYNKHKNNLDVFTLEHYKNIATLKTAHYSIKLPVLLALLLVKNGKEKATKEIDHICLELGRFIQIRDDYFDVYADKTTTGKVGTDIQEGKCTWMSVVALQRCNETQRSIFKECYGSKDEADVKQIKQLYDDLNMPQVYEQYMNVQCMSILCRE